MPIADRSFLEPALVRDPHPYLHALRAEDPVHWSVPHQAWILTRYDDVAAAFRDERLSAARVPSLLPIDPTADDRRTFDPIYRLLGNWMVFTDNPDHARLRRLARAAFSVRMIERLRPAIADLVDGLLAGIAREERVDFVRRFAFPLPATVIARLLGVPEEDLGRFRQWSEDVAALVFGAAGGIERRDRAIRGLLALEGYFRDLLARLPRDPAEPAARHTPAGDESEPARTCAGPSVLRQAQDERGVRGHRRSADGEAEAERGHAPRSARGFGGHRRSAAKRAPDGAPESMDHRTGPRDRGETLLSGLARAEEKGDVLSADEVTATCVLLLFAGHETTANLLGTSVFHLDRLPEARRRLAEDPAIAPAAVEECLRFDGPTKMQVRIAREDLAIRARTIRAGQRVLLCQSAANRDPERFPDPDRLDLERAGGEHLAFGVGIHFCLGAPLARLEAEIALAALARTLPGLRVADDDPAWQATILSRGLASLAVRPR